MVFGQRCEPQPSGVLGPGEAFLQASCEAITKLRVDSLVRKVKDGILKIPGLEALKDRLSKFSSEPPQWGVLCRLAVLLRPPWSLLDMLAAPPLLWRLCRLL